LLKPVMQQIRAASALELQLVVTGAHLAAAYGSTVDEITQDGFSIDARLDLELGDDSQVGIAAAMGRALGGTAEVLARLQPELVLVLGDRYEIFAAVAAALVARIPVAHLHGGETTEGAMDEALRHAISKMSHLHFVAAEDYRDRVIQLGEQPDRVFVVGGLGVDAMRQVPLLTREQLESQLDFHFGAKSLLVTFHPATLDKGEAAAQTRELLAALDELRDTSLLFTLPNADTESRAITALIEEFVASHPQARSFHSLGQRRYLSCLAQVDGVVGNRRRVDVARGLRLRDGRGGRRNGLSKLLTGGPRLGLWRCPCDSLPCWCASVGHWRGV
jgi:GDP/UDP-N,N'-diacetylbacillosamine 2-epimerase (hydrolysing)